jgi:hypothetical protein
VYILEVRPHTDRISMRAELLNEVLLVAICYHFVLFTNLIEDEDMRVYAGYSLLAHLILLLAVNIGTIVYVNMVNLYGSLRLKYLKRKQANLILKRRLKAAAEREALIKRRAVEKAFEEQIDRFIRGESVIPPRKKVEIH